MWSKPSGSEANLGLSAKVLSMFTCILLCPPSLPSRIMCRDHISVSSGYFTWFGYSLFCLLTKSEKSDDDGSSCAVNGTFLVCQEPPAWGPWGAHRGSLSGDHGGSHRGSLSGDRGGRIGAPCLGTVGGGASGQPGRDSIGFTESPAGTAASTCPGTLTSLT